MPDTNKGLIAWFARNTVAANLLMLFIIIGGLMTATTIRKQMFPQQVNQWLQVSVGYPGAAPQEVEEGITIKIEEALESVQGLKRVITYSNRNYANSWIEVEDSYDVQEVLDEVKQQVDSINSFPDGMERPVVRKDKERNEVLYVSLYGDLDDRHLKDMGRLIHDEIQALPQVNVSEFYGGLDYEIGIEVSKDKLREFNLSFRDIAAAVRNFSANMSAGQIKAENGYISMRVESQAYRGHEFERLPLLNLADGTQVLLGDIATIRDGFEEGLRHSKFNGQNSVTFFIGAALDQSMDDVADVMYAFIEQKQKTLPQGVYLEPWVDMTYYVDGRLQMMLDNMLWGGLLVFLILAMFLRFRLAFWVMMGLPVSFLGTLLFMPMEYIDVTINVVSLFGFILVLGIVVDDAIVMGESAHDEIERHGHSLDNVIRGVKRVAMPATFGVLTTIAAFMPMVLSDGPEASQSQAIGFVVILCLLFSLVESKLILPAHLGKMKFSEPNPRNPLHQLRSAIDGSIKHIVEKHYQPFLARALHYRYTVMMVFVAVLLISAGIFQGGLLRFIGMPKIPHDFPRLTVEMKQSSSDRATMLALTQIEKTLYDVDKQLVEEFGQPMISDMRVMLESRTQGQITVKLVEPDERPLNTFEVAERWREAMPPIPGMKSLHVADSLFGAGRDDGDISFRLIGTDETQLVQAAAELKRKLSSIKGVADINDSRQSNTDEVQFVLKPQAYSLGLTLADVASQVNYSFYGLEAQRILRNGEEIKVMIRYPESQRDSIGHIEHTLIQTPDGAEVPLSEVAEITLTDGVNRIRRENGKRTVNVWASVDSAQVESFEVAKDVRDNFLPQMLKAYPNVESEVAGRVQEEMDSRNTQMRNFVLSMLVIFCPAGGAAALLFAATDYHVGDPVRGDRCDVRPPAAGAGHELDVGIRDHRRRGRGGQRLAGNGGLCQQGQAAGRLGARGGD